MLQCLVLLPSTIHHAKCFLLFFIRYLFPLFISKTLSLSLSHISLLSHQKFLSVAHYKQLKIEFRFGFGLWVWILWLWVCGCRHGVCGCGFGFCGGFEIGVEGFRASSCLYRGGGGGVQTVTDCAFDPKH